MDLANMSPKEVRGADKRAEDHFPHSGHVRGIRPGQSRGAAERPGL